tara:strand:+ start:182 stop:592 length:411 start_codon:yes stop_codon:yes gene_type:complete
MILRIRRSTYNSLIEWLDDSSPKKIAAIKAVRSETKCGLREAKEAVELFAYEKGFTNHKPTTEHRIHVGPIIKKMVVDYGSGEVAVDLESMELKALMEMQTIGIDACSDILNLVSVLKAYEEGRDIYARGEDDEDR